MQNLIPISAIVITKNEEKNIQRCLDSLTWIKEVVMVDSKSNDNTIPLASSYPNVKIISAEWKGFSANKKLAVSNTTYEWILWIDADEVITTELKSEIQKLISSKDLEDAYDIPRKTFFMGEWVRHTGWYPGRVIRFFNKEFCDFNDNLLHEGIELKNKSRLGHIQSDMLHYSYTSLYQYFDKMNYYGKTGAEELLRKNKKFIAYQLLINPLATFIKFYFLKKGFLDGTKGFIISVGSAFSNFIKYTNLYYLSKKGKA